MCLKINAGFAGMQASVFVLTTSPRRDIDIALRAFPIPLRFDGDDRSVSRSVLVPVRNNRKLDVLKRNHRQMTPAEFIK